ncbi:MAG: hypothetical protein C1943_12760 [Halochromatium sp.]|nr:hypothetical protein [Halochromatium sp.]
MAAVAVAVASMACFLVVLKLTAVHRVLAMIPSTAVAGVTAMLNTELDDDAKEHAVQQAGLRLLILAWQISWRIALALGSVGIPILTADLLDLVQSEISLSILMRFDVIVIFSILGILLALALKQLASAPGDQSDKISDSNAYGAGGRLVHALAFSGPSTQQQLARFDNWLFADTIADIPDNPPIFITSLARGGTTALLNAMHDLPLISTHRYCDMPFMSAPMLWSQLARRSRVVAERERAHGDGIRINLQSPEGFDEIFWRLYWPEKYRKTALLLWQRSDFKAEAQHFFRMHFRKIAKLRHPITASAVRYLSKNNANIARLDLLPTLFPGCQLIIALREPSAHSASLHRQHLNFIHLHNKDAFAMRYMKDIGHLEFGALHRPIAFDPDVLAGYDPTQPNYWLVYWITAFEHIRKHISKLLILSQDSLRSAPQNTMDILLERLNIGHVPTHDFRRYFHCKPDAPMSDLFDADLLRRARDTYEHLLAFAVR